MGERTMLPECDLNSPRLLAYGGTGFLERRRIGAWPSIPEGVLQDLHGLPPGATGYGCGLLGGRPFLVFRERQNLSNRGGYAYTLLLDPGAPCWNRFGWNAALLLRQVAHHPVSAELLFGEPERCTSDALVRLGDQLRPEVGEPRAEQEQSEIAGLWVGAVAQAESVLVGRPGPRPHLDVLAGALETLAPCFRVGRGWLIGSARAHGQALGAHLVWDDEPAGPAPDPQPVVERGRSALAAWRLLESRPEFRLKLRVLSRVPLWRWPAQAHEVIGQVERAAARQDHVAQPRRLCRDELGVGSKAGAAG